MLLSIASMIVYQLTPWAGRTDEILEWFTEPFNLSDISFNLSQFFLLLPSRLQQGRREQEVD